MNRFLRDVVKACKPVSATVSRRIHAARRHAIPTSPQAGARNVAADRNHDRRNWRQSSDPCRNGCARGIRPEKCTGLGIRCPT